jgi:Domain of unknown function (DUF4386)
MDETTPSLKSVTRIAGIAYLIQITTSVLGYLPGQLIVSGDIAQTATNIIASERLFRFGVASNLITYVTVIVLTWALYRLLRPINKNLALLAVLMRMVEVIVLSVGVIDELVTIRLLTSAVYQNTFEASQLPIFARLAMVSYGSSFSVGFIFLGIGSAVFSYVLLKSNYIPKALAWWGIFSSLLIGLGTFVIILFPELRMIFPYGYGPMGIYEVGLGLWLVIKGIAISGPLKSIQS